MYYLNCHNIVNKTSGYWSHILFRVSRGSATCSGVTENKSLVVVYMLCEQRQSRKKTTPKTVKKNVTGKFKITKQPSFNSSCIK